MGFAFVCDCVDETVVLFVTSISRTKKRVEISQAGNEWRERIVHPKTLISCRQMRRASPTLAPWPHHRQTLG